VRRGIAYLGRRADGAGLLERRAESGLLGGVLGWPGTDWAQTAPPEAPPATADWQPLPGEVRHTFTHFHLRMELRAATLPIEATPTRGAFVAHADFRPAALPTVMRKAFDMARAWHGA